jgi:hypothetical protein
LGKCEYFLGEEQLYKTILKIGRKEAAEKNKSKIFFNLGMQLTDLPTTYSI